MPNYQADLSLNQLLGLLRHYQAEGWSKQGSQFSFQNMQTSAEQFNSTFQVTNRTQESPQRIRMAMTTPNHTTNKHGQGYHQKSQQGRIFDRLYRENQKLKEKRERLWRQARKEYEKKDQKECTFSPCIGSKRGSCERSLSKNDSMYVKNIEWQQRKNQSIKVKQMQRNGESLKDLTFTPKINSFKHRSNKQNSQLLRSTKGVSEHIQRQSKAKRTADSILETRLRQPSPPKACTIRKGYFSYRS